MKQTSFSFEVLTPALAGGAQPHQRAEIRPASIRGQLRWWFRVLGGFKTQTGSVRSREANVFGAIDQNASQASPLVVRVTQAPPSTPPKTMEELGAKPFSEKGYLLWPLRRPVDARATIAAGAQFQLQILWRGDAALWPSIQALIAVFAHLGSLGFRGRRAMGALTATGTLDLARALAHFSAPGNISIKAMAASNGENALFKLGGWLQGWRAHGRTGDNEREKKMPGFKWARSDHDLAASLLSGNPQRPPFLFRAALGLPLTQRFTKGGGEINWAPREAGRFASPVLLRPHRTPGGSWSALVIFIHNHEWPQGEPVSGGPKRTAPVSLELLRAMQSDPNLDDFLP